MVAKKREHNTNPSRSKLEKERSEVERRLTAIEVTREELEQEEKELSRRKRKLETLLDAYCFSRGGIKVTEHAVLRYLERVKGLNMDRLLDQMFDCPGFEDKVSTLGTGLIPIGEGVYARVIKKHVVTILVKED